MANDKLRDTGLVHLSLVRPVTMMMLLLSSIVIGIVALVNIPIELIPAGFSPPFMQVEVPYANATAQDIEDRITRPLEQALSTTPKLDELSATSRSDRASLSLVFEGDTDMNIAYREVRDRVARARADLPSDVERVRINKQSGASLPVAFYGISWDESVELPRDKLQKHLVRAIERIDGVGVVNVWGQEDREIRIELNRPLAEAAGVNIFQLAQTLTKANFNLASGDIRDPEGKFVIRSLATYQTVSQLEDTIVGAKNLRLKDIAQVVYDYPETERIDRYNGRPSMVMFVLKESQANTVEVCERIKLAVEEAKKSPQLAGFQLENIFMQGDAIRFSLDQVTSSGLQGGVLAIFVLLFFLRRVRLTLLIAASIPLSIFLALPVMYFMGQSINLVSLLGLMICVGLVVDNSVVVAENIEHYRGRGMGPYAAALHGASEVALPITLATLTTMIVFAPAALLSSGVTQFFMIRMVTPVCVSLLASLFVALALVPIASAVAFRDATPLLRSRTVARAGAAGRPDVEALDHPGVRGDDGPDQPPLRARAAGGAAAAHGRGGAVAADVHPDARGADDAGAVLGRREHGHAQLLHLLLDAGRRDGGGGGQVPARGGGDADGEQGGVSDRGAVHRLRRVLRAGAGVLREADAG
jgi:HAE1 family hydrophobic/amphiphilic exporter-1